MRPALFGFLLLPGVAIAGAPFCVVSGAGQQCFYSDASSCYSAARTLNGMCVANTQQPTSPAASALVIPSPPQPAPRTNLYDNMMRGAEMAERGRREALERREAEARIAALQAQAMSSRTTQPDGTWGNVVEHVRGRPFDITYQCQDSTGRVYLTKEVSVGCVVYAVD